MKKEKYPTMSPHPTLSRAYISEEGQYNSNKLWVPDFLVWYDSPRKWFAKWRTSRHSSGPYGSKTKAFESIKLACRYDHAKNMKNTEDVHEAINDLDICGGEISYRVSEDLYKLAKNSDTKEFPASIRIKLRSAANKAMQLVNMLEEIRVKLGLPKRPSIEYTQKHL